MFDVRLVNPRYDLCPSENCEDCPLNPYGMTCTSHRVEYWEEQRGKKEKE